MTDITDAGPRLKAMDDALTGFDQMRAEIDRLRKREAELLAAGDRLESQLCEAARERDRRRLTDAEREALHWFAHYGLPEHRAATLRGLLERLSGPGQCGEAGQ